MSLVRFRRPRVVIAAGLAFVATLSAAPTSAAADRETISADDYQVSGWLTHDNRPFAVSSRRWGRGMLGATADAELIDVAERRRLIDVLDLGEDEQALLTSLAEETNHRYLGRRVRMQETLADLQAEMRVSRNWDRQQKREADIKAEYVEQREAELNRFYDDLQVMIDASSQDRWPILERDRRRSELLRPTALFFAEILDPVEIVQSVEIADADRDAAFALLDAYVSEMDGLLVARERHAATLSELGREYNELEAEQREIWNNAGPEWSPEVQQRQEQLGDEMLRLRLRGTEPAVAMYNSSVRAADLNERYLDELRRTLSDDAVAKIDQAVAALEEQYAAPFAAQCSSFDNLAYLADWSRVTNAVGSLAPEIMDIDDLAGAEELSAEQRAVMRQIQQLAGTLRAAGPTRQSALTDAQRDQLRELIERFKQEREPLVERMQQAAANPAAEEFGLLYVEVRIPSGGVRLDRHSDDPEEMQRLHELQWARHRGGDEQDDSPQRRAAQELIELEQRTLDEIRAILTVQQRAAIANF